MMTFFKAKLTFFFKNQMENNLNRQQKKINYACKDLFWNILHPPWLMSSLADGIDQQNAAIGEGDWTCCKRGRVKVGGEALNEFKCPQGITWKLFLDIEVHLNIYMAALASIDKIHLALTTTKLNIFSWFMHQIFLTENFLNYLHRHTELHWLDWQTVRHNIFLLKFPFEWSP